MMFVEDVVIADCHRLSREFWGFILSNYKTESKEVLICRKESS
jgi:hypothetical protein